jgi:16S rRNA (cytosine1402-N4)-methyltransferase
MISHVSVMLSDVIRVLSEQGRFPCTVLDCTLGAAGHTVAMLEKFSSAKVLSCDLDSGAIARASKMTKQAGVEARWHGFHGNFADVFSPSAASALPDEFHAPYGAILMDLGYSSDQLHDPTFGMSFQTEAPLDMRLSRPPTGPTAWELLLESNEQQLGEILSLYGEISGAFALARDIKAAVNDGKIVDSTLSLAQFMQARNPPRAGKSIHPATTVFQALRIAVNDELRNLDRFLKSATMNTAQGALLLVISFHSLEDRIVKHFGAQNRDHWRALSSKPFLPSEEELQSNPRARSAKMRVFVRL